MRPTKKKSTISFFDEFADTRIFEFVREDYKFIIVGYPFWRAYVTSLDGKFRIEVYPKIDVRERKIDIPKQKELQPRQNLESGTVETIGIASDSSEMSTEDLQKESDFFEHIPKEIAEHVIVFKDSHWEFLKALTYFGDNFRLLLTNNPALCYLIVNLENLNHSYSFYNHLAYIEHLITDKKKEILARAGFQGSERLVKIFSKIEPHLLDVNLLVSFRDTLQRSDPDLNERILKILSHTKSISYRLLEVMSMQPGIVELISNRCLTELMNCADKYERYLKLLNKISVRAKKWQLRIPEIDNLSQIKSFFEKLKEQTNALERGSEFPPPPLPDNEHITALKTQTEIRTWAIQQKNCIRSYIKDVKLGKCYFYKVIYNGEEATLEIRTGRAEIKMGQLLGKGNKRVSDKIKFIVREWFFQITPN